MRKKNGFQIAEINGQLLVMSNESTASKNYEATTVGEDVQAIFRGGLAISQALQILRSRLLDLSTRNRLLNFKFPKGRSIRFVAVKNFDSLYGRVIDGRLVRLSPVPEPDRSTLPVLPMTEPPDAREQAKRLGISTSFDHDEPIPDGHTGRRGTEVQTLFYPAELERLSRKMTTEARTAIEETGSNILYLVFGFLEFYEADSSEKPLMAPLLSVPVNLKKGEIDPETNVYRYNVVYSGEDVAENFTLREKLKQDFRLNLPEFGEDDTPESYLKAIQDCVRKKQRWRVRRQLSLAMLSFGKLAIWADIDPVKHRHLLKHDLLKSIFEGNGNGGGGDPIQAEDYEIDDHSQVDLPLIYDADSSQHSALIDALAGKDMVINGPPGTGKSQTITNIIATAMRDGKTVLFVSEKMAALEVVRKRLDKANLGHFCLELHSNKTHKRKLLEDIHARLQAKFQKNGQLSALLEVLVAQRTKLQRHAELMGSRVANNLDMTVAEILWALERHRQQLGDLDQTARKLTVSNAVDMDHSAVEMLKTFLSDVAARYRAVGGVGSHHPWWGFKPKQLTPGDEQDIREIIIRSLNYAQELQDACLKMGGEGMTAEQVVTADKEFERLPQPPEGLLAARLPIMFGDDSSGKASFAALTKVVELVSGIREDRSVQRSILSPDANPSVQDFSQANRLVGATEGDQPASRTELFSRSLGELKSLCATIMAESDKFSQLVDALHPKYESFDAEVIAAITQAFDNLSAFPISETPLDDLRSRGDSLQTTADRLRHSLATVSAKAAKWHVDFDGTPEAVTALSNPVGLSGLLPSVEVTEEVLVQARGFSDSPLAANRLQDIEADLNALLGIIDEAKSAHDALTSCARETGQDYDGSLDSVAELVCLAKVASEAPEELLPYRRKQFEHAHYGEIFKKASADHAREVDWHAELAERYYLEELPSVDELKQLSRLFREGDSIFNIFKKDWRKAKKRFRNFTKGKVKHSADVMQVECMDLAAWSEHHITYVNNREYTEWFGELFAGPKTDFVKIESLGRWYGDSLSAVFECGTLSDKVDLTSLEHKKICQLSARAKTIMLATETLSKLENKLAELLPFNAHPRALLKIHGWDRYIADLSRRAEQFRELLDFFKPKAHGAETPQRAVELLEAKFDLAGATGELSELVCGKATIARIAGDDFSVNTVQPSRRWNEAIDDVQALAMQFGALASLLERFVQGPTSPKTALNFLNFKINLDRLVRDAPVLRRPATLKNWEEYLDSIKAICRDLEILTTLLGRFAPDNRPASEVLKAIRAKTNADAKDELLSTDPDIQRYFGGHIDSERTDIPTLEATWKWGNAVASSALPPHMKFSILHEDAPQAFQSNVASAKHGASSFQSMHKVIDQLSDHGQFDWNTWFQQKSADGGSLSHKVVERLQRAADAIDDVIPWGKYFNARKTCEQHGLQGLTKFLEDGLLPPESLPVAFERAFYGSVAKEIYRRHSPLSDFMGQTHEKLRDKFMKADREIIRVNGLNIAHQIDKEKRVPTGMTGPRACDQTELHLVLREIAKQKKHIPIRQLIKRAGATLQALKPCFMMGPLSVAQYLEYGSVEFDLVVMDEASQLRPEDALGAIARGKQLIVVGDPKQLPPTSFFDRILDGADGDEVDTPAALEGTESILDICQQLFTPVRTLRWHYRSQHQSLIAFSNFHFYDNSLVVFPSPHDRGRNLGVLWQFVKDGTYKDRRNAPEAHRIADAVLAHMLEHPEESLGVVSLNQTQRDLILDILEKKLKSFKEGGVFQAHWENEGMPFFVKNLENVQGDERDVIFISTTFGKSPGAEKPRQNFGPISRPEGWRRLNVLFTRARRRLALFTSMQPEDIVVDEKTPAGTRALRDYLDFAKHGILVKTDYAGAREPDSDFEVSVANVLKNLGYEVHPQLGVANFFIDMAVRNPDRRGEFLAAIECDGAMYHSSASARDRDRIRQEILESLGWRGKIWRIWSADWFSNPSKEVQRLINFLEKCRHVSATESPVFYEEKPSDESPSEGSGISDAVIKNNQEDDAADAVGIEGQNTADIFVEIGNTITISFLDTPKERRAIKIVEGPHPNIPGVIGEDTPLAQAILGLEVGEIGTVNVTRHPPRKVKVIMIE